MNAAQFVRHTIDNILEVPLFAQLTLFHPASPAYQNQLRSLYSFSRAGSKTARDGARRGAL
jgi:hypothetical protein